MGCSGYFDSPLETGLHQARMSHDEDRARANKPEESAKGGGDPEQRDTYNSNG